MTAIARLPLRPTLAFAAFLALVVLAAWHAADDFSLIEACLDRGGAWSEAAERCFDTLAERDAWEARRPAEERP